MVLATIQWIHYIVLDFELKVVVRVVSIIAGFLLQAAPLECHKFVLVLVLFAAASTA